MRSIILLMSRDYDTVQVRVVQYSIALKFLDLLIFSYPRTCSYIPCYIHYLHAGIQYFYQLKLPHTT